MSTVLRSRRSARIGCTASAILAPGATPTPNTITSASRAAMTLNPAAQNNAANPIRLRTSEKAAGRASMGQVPVRRTANPGSATGAGTAGANFFAGTVSGAGTTTFASRNPASGASGGFLDGSWVKDESSTS